MKNKSLECKTSRSLNKCSKYALLYGKAKSIRKIKKWLSQTKKWEELFKRDYSTEVKYAFKNLTNKKKKITIEVSLLTNTKP